MPDPAGTSDDGTAGTQRHGSQRETINIPTTRPPPQGVSRWWTALKTLSPRNEMERLRTGQLPCARNSALLGIGTGTALAGVGMIARRNLLSSLNWGVGAAVFVSLASFQTCRSAMKAEKEQVQKFVQQYKHHKVASPSSGSRPAGGSGTTAQA